MLFSGRSLNDKKNCLPLRARSSAVSLTVWLNSGSGPGEMLRKSTAGNRGMIFSLGDRISQICTPFLSRRDSSAMSGMVRFGHRDKASVAVSRVRHSGDTKAASGGGAVWRRLAPAAAACMRPRSVRRASLCATFKYGQPSSPRRQRQTLPSLCFCNANTEVFLVEELEKGE